MWSDKLIKPGEQGGPTTTTWQFTPPIFAYGGYWNLAGPGGAGSAIAVSVNGISVGEIPNNYSGQFWGFVSTEPFSNVLLQSGTAYGWCETYEMDNMVYAFAGGLEFIKIDDVNDGDCVVPGREINYTISYDFIGAGDTNVLLIDYLPVGVDYNSSSPEGDYNAVDRTVIWDIGTVPTGGSGTFILTCLVNHFAEPCSIMTNFCEISGDSTQETAEVNTPVCFWNQIIYVDHNAAGLNNGLSWEDAYTNLQNALNRAAIDGNSEIWVAAGTYKPSVPSPGYRTFQLIDGIPVYGHFAGNETSRGQRDLNDPNNETVLSGVGVSNQYVVTATLLAPNNILDGFKITGGSYAGINIVSSYLDISNCLITNNGGKGINASSSNFTVNGCIIQNNSNHGIFASGSAFSVADSIVQNNSQNGICSYFSYWTLPETRIENSIIQNNTSEGIYVREIDSPVKIANSLILKNHSHGIALHGYCQDVMVRNNTLSGNQGRGITYSMYTPPKIRNCISWDNISPELSTGMTVTYSCVKGGYSGLGNISDDPCFVGADINDFHLSKDSNCIDAGDPNFADFNEIDIDGQCRIMVGKTTVRADIGADELYWLKADFDRNEIVNFNDYVIWSPAWQTIDPNKTLDTDEDVDIDDLDLFSDYWLCEGPWEE